MRSRLTAIPVVIVALLVAGAAIVGFAPAEHPPAPAAVTVTRPAARPEVRLVGAWPAPPEKPKHPTSFLVADAIGPTVGLYAEPEVPYAERPSMDNPTHEGLPVVFRVLDDRGEWLRVQVSMRPNGFEAWVRSDEVSLRRVPNWIEVELSTRTVRAFHGDTELFRTTSVVGSDRTPTPVGTFFVDGWVPLSGSGPYGAGQISVAGFSEVLTSFGGGVGQIAIHGTNRPELMGSAVSNGCVRLVDDDLRHLALLAPLGTPVVVKA